MRIEIQGLGFPLTAALLDHTERRLRFALTRSGDRIKRVVVRLGDTNGPRGGEDPPIGVTVMSVAEKFEQWWNENWSKLTGSRVLAAYHAGYIQGCIDSFRDTERPARKAEAAALAAGRRL